MSEEMVERVARALCHFQRPCPGKACGACSDKAGDVLACLDALGLVIVPRKPTEDRIRQAVVAMLLDRFSDRYSGDPVMHEPEAQLLAGIVLAALEGGK